MGNPETIELQITRLTRLIALVGLAGLLVLSGITVGEVLLRWIFKFPIHGVFDLSQLVIVIIVSSCLPLVSAERRHITVRIAGTVAGQRVNAFLEALGALITMLIFGLMTWQLWIYTNELSRANEATWLMQWPVAPWWRVATAVIGICAAIQFVLFLISMKYGITLKKDPVLKTDTNPEKGNEEVSS